MDFAVNEAQKMIGSLLFNGAEQGPQGKDLGKGRLRPPDGPVPFSASATPLSQTF